MKIGRHVRLSIEWEPRDLFVGIYWTLVGGTSWPLHVYILIVPTLAIHINARRRWLPPRLPDDGGG